MKYILVKPHQWKHTANRLHCNYCIPAAYSPLPIELQNLISKDDNGHFSLGEALSCFSMILEAIFKLLDRDDLHNVRLVNTEWRRIANRELQKRIATSWLGYCKNSFRLYVDKNIAYNNPAFAIVAYNLRSIKSSEIICYNDSKHHMPMSFKEYLEQKLLGNSLSALMIKCVGVTCTYDCLQSSLLQTKKYCKGVFQYTQLPNIPKINTTLIKFGMKEVPKFCAEDEIIRCALLFTNMKCTKALCNQLSFGQYQHSMALGGGLIEHVEIIPRHELHSRISCHDAFCILFTQEKGVQTEFEALSLVLHGDLKMCEDLILRYKQKTVFRTHGILFKLTCYARNSKMEEIILITKHFPNYHMFNIEVSGEIGWDACSESSEAANPSFPDDLVRPPLAKYQKTNGTVANIVVRSMSTILVFITWGSKR